VFVYRAPVDMRKAYDTLSALVVGPMKKSLLSGDTFVFIGRAAVPTPEARELGGRLLRQRHRHMVAWSPGPGAPPRAHPAEDGRSRDPFLEDAH
jgi:transposase